MKSWALISVLTRYTSAIVLGLLSFLAFAGMGGEGQPSTQLQPVVTAEERLYLQSLGPISMCVDPDWAPFERINEQGLHEGIAADLIQLVASRLGISIQLLPVKLWRESLEASRQKRCQIMSFLNQTPERDQWLIFTAPIFSDPNVIVTREEHGFIPDLHALRGKRVALPGGTMVEERIHRDFPSLKVIVTNSERESVTLVSERKAEMTIRSLISAAYAIRKEGLFNLKISGQVPEYTNYLRIGVHQDYPQLRDILDKGVASLTAQEKEAIWNRHVAVTVQEGIDYQLVWKVLVGAALIVGVVVYWNRKLHRLNRELERLSITDRLTGLFNRMKLDETLERELAYAKRFGQVFSVILLDIDHFKRINDGYGHHAGDAALVCVANRLRQSIRETDVVGRWGGEEFMIICPHTDMVGAGVLAENLRSRLAATPVDVLDLPITASFGVAGYAPGDDVEDTVGRADLALYDAKRSGRNQVKKADLNSHA